jgi:uncharacterized membrane protein YkoI
VTDVKTIAGAVGIVVLAAMALSQTAFAQPKWKAHRAFRALVETVEPDAPQLQLMQSQGEFPVTASDAAEIARGSVPGSTVLKVRLLPSGVYAVTLKDGDNVSKVMVDATTGNIS